VNVENGRDIAQAGQKQPQMAGFGFVTLWTAPNEIMAATTDFGVIPPFTVQAPADQRVPFVFNSPHSGRIYPQRFLEMSKLDRVSIRRSEDCYVDELFAGVVALGAPLLAANFPRAWLDANREPWELDPRMFNEPLPGHANTRSARVAGGLGTIPRLVGEGQDIYLAKLPLSEAVGRIESVYKPYHEQLKSLLMQTHARFGFGVLIDCHSMPGSVRAADASTKPDFIVGDRFGVACSPSLSHAAISILSDMGYTVAHNKPYAGGFITEHYGRPAKGLHAIQIEVNRGIYMNEKTLERTAGFDALQRDLTRFCADIMSVPDFELHGLPLAAE
jgi:N-formylglutamate amidohydrolase